MDKATRQCPQTTTFLKRKESRSGIEPRSFRLSAYRLTARPNRLSLLIVAVGRFYRLWPNSPLSSRLAALLSYVILNECLFHFFFIYIARFEYHPSGVLTALFSCYMAGTT